MKRKNSSGQALLVILLVMAVALTIGLSVVSRSITDIRLSQQQEESARVFSIAEAGLESLLAGQELPSFEGFDITTDTWELGSSDSFVFPTAVKAGETQSVWLVSHDGDALDDDFRDFNDFTFYWGNEGLTGGSNTDPALEAVVIYQTGGQYTTRRVAFDPKIGRSGGFKTASVGNFLFGEKTFSFRAKFTDDRAFPSGNFYALRIKLLYNDEPQILGIKSDGADLPLQGSCYQVGAQSAETGIARKVEQCQLYKALPAIFDYVLFSESSL